MSEQLIQEQKDVRFFDGDVKFVDIFKDYGLLLKGILKQCQSDILQLVNLIKVVKKII